MTATSIEIDTRAINNPEFGPPTSRDFERINTTLSFYLLLPEGIRTLSTNSASVGSSPEGLLYVPTLDDTDPCVNASSPYVPDNVTRRPNLPNLAFPPVAIAPWLSPQCVQSYLAAARRDTARSFVFFLPNQGTDTPPSANDAAWGLSDGGRWKGDNPYPVYAISSSAGQTLMQQSALYSGPNLTTAPNGQQLGQLYDRNDYAKLYIDINLSVTAGLPSLWIFLVVILAVLVSIVGIISSAMHFIQRRRRQQLRRRVANGEVDLEVLGVKRLLVPQEILNKMPVYPYEKAGAVTASSLDEERKSASPSPNPIGKKNHETETINKHGHGRMPSMATNHFDQPACAICLDDFVANEAMVRELPCEHIFHPECVDVFLTQNSSLCPLCKKSALPAGYCPDVITNVMVRRERNLRRARERGERPDTLEADARQMMNNLVRERHRRQRENADIELGFSRPQPPAPVANPQVNPASPPSPPPANRQERREWARRRAEAMIGPDAPPLDPEVEQTRTVPAWRRGLRKVFPALR
ncbi:hypothetical protein B9Z65_3198 [Elsinoe australis]|uniref:RING-type domain-containing protein n=1 Tax=Elsinoe australis TaxID=40998 RepID=A0A2P7ZUP4_9PEZI|nr:hypothetical protein B9Z65_3198 [Elsinoe australis]